MTAPPTSQRPPAASSSADGVARIFWIAVALAGASAAYAVSGARDLIYDGSFYLLGIASHGAFQLFEPGRVSVQVLQQCFAVLGSRLGVHDLWTLSLLYSLGASGWPVVLTALCWLALPQGEKNWIAGPLINLVFVIPTTSLIGVGEGIIASCLLWLAVLLVCFRMRNTWSAALALGLTIACVFSHESAVLCLALIAACAALQVRGTKGFTRAVAVCIVAAAAAGAIYMLRWILIPRSAIERGDFLVSLLGGFLGTPYALNLPATACLAAAAAIVVALSHKSAIRRSAILLFFAALALLLLAIVVMPGETLAPSRSFAARGLPVALTTLLAIVLYLMKRRGIFPAQFAKGPALAIILGLSIFQLLAQAIMTERWNAYANDLRGLVSTRKGAVSHAEAMRTLDPEGARFRRELLESWSVEPLSIVLAPRGRVMAVVQSAPTARWTPYRLDEPATMPRAPGLDWSGFASVQR